MGSIKPFRYFRYRLTTLLGIMLVIAIAAAAYGNRLRTIERQEEAFRQIAARGWYVHVYPWGTEIFFEELPPLFCTNGLQRVVESDNSPEIFADKDCRLFNDIIDLQRVHFPGSQVSRDGVIAFVCSHRHCRVTNKPFAEWE